LKLQGTSLGGTSTIKLLGNSALDISFHDAPGVTIGSVEGSGTAFLGARNLTVGSNNLSTTFSGMLKDGGEGGGSGGSLTKIGSASLALTNASTYTGATVVNAGRLLVNNATGSGTGSGAAAVFNNGSVLGGSGVIGGAVTVNADTILVGGDATTASGALTIAGNVTLNSGSIIALVLGNAGAHSTLTRTGGVWAFAPNQKFTFLDLGAQPGFYDNIIAGLAADPGDTASWTITNAGFAGTFTYDGAGNIDLNLTATSGPVLQLASAVSRKTHGVFGTFDVPLPLSGEPGVECRSGNGSLALVFTFTNEVVGGTASVTTGAGRVTGTPVFAGNTMTVNLAGVADVQKITVTLQNVRDTLAQLLPDKAIKVSMLVGDTNGNRTVNASDIGQTKGQSGAVLSADNFRADINASGSVNASDIGQAKANAGHTLPPEV
jgi:autotransporter-associated beta strand protein